MSSAFPPPPPFLVRPAIRLRKLRNARAQTPRRPSTLPQPLADVGHVTLQDCNKVVATKFFPTDAQDGSGKQFPLCETDYFRRLGLLCSKCGTALRGSYITALGEFLWILWEL